MKKIIPMVSFLFLLAGCEQDQTKKIDSEEGSFTLQPTEQYGRGAKSDGKDTNSAEEATKIITNESEELIVYFSRSGNTENLAHLVHRETNADSLELSIKDPYPADYEETVERADQELLPNAKIISRFSIEDSKVVDSEEEILDWLRGI